MEIQKATGVVLHSRDSLEADVIARVYTREYGKRSFVIKGLKKSRTRSLSAVEAGAVISLVYYYREGREHQVPREFKPVKHYLSLRENLEKYLHLCFILETVDRTTGFNDPDPGLFSLLAAGIDTLAGDALSVHLSLFFLLRLLDLQGILPDFTGCGVCGNRDYDDFAVDTRDFLPVCRDCLMAGVKTGKLLPRSGRDYIEQALSKKYNAIDHEKFDGEALFDLLFHVTLFMENYFHVRIKSKSMIFTPGER